MGLLDAASAQIGSLVNGGTLRGMVGPPRLAQLRTAVGGKVVLVTGASAGTGRAVAKRLGRAGATVLLVARSAERLDAVAREIRDRGGDAYVLPCDLADPDAAAALGRRALREHVGVDVVVSNAGLSIRRSLELSYDRFHDYERTIAVNYLGPVALLLTLLPSMRERGSGHVVNVSTIGVQLPGVPRYTAYLASKAAFDAWLRGAAPELRHDGVACTSMYVGLVHTGMSDATAMYRVLPGLSADRAAVDVCWAIVQRPAVTAPPWAAVAGAALGLGREIAEPLLAAYYGHSDDSAAARGVEDEGELEIPALRGLGVRPAVRS